MTVLGSRPLDFAKWYLRNRFRLMEEFLQEFDVPPAEADLPELRARFLEATGHARKVMVARLVVTALLGASIIATVAAAVLNTLWFPDPVAADVERTERLLAQIAAYAGSATVVLVLLRLAFDRYLRLVETSATFLAIEIASARAAFRKGAKG